MPTFSSLQWREEGARAGTAWEGEGEQVIQFIDLLPLTLPLLRNGPRPLSQGERENHDCFNQKLNCSSRDESVTAHQVYTRMGIKT